MLQVNALSRKMQRLLDLFAQIRGQVPGIAQSEAELCQQLLQQLLIYESNLVKLKKLSLQNAVLEDMQLVNLPSVVSELSAQVSLCLVEGNPLSRELVKMVLNREQIDLVDEVEEEVSNACEKNSFESRNVFVAERGSRHFKFFFVT